MRKQSIVLGILFSLLFATATAKASIIKYDVSGTTYLWMLSPPDASDGDAYEKVLNMTGCIYVSDIDTYEEVGRDYYEIILYDIRIGNTRSIGHDNAGYIYFNPMLDVFIVLYGDDNDRLQWTEEQPRHEPGLPSYLSINNLDIEWEHRDNYDYFLRNLGDNWNMSLSSDITLTRSAPIPEPASMLLLGTGLIGWVGFRKKLKK